MTNRERYTKEILDIVCSGDGLAVRKDDKRLIACTKISCSDCYFNSTGGCGEATFKWAESEYIEKPVISKRDKAFLDYLKCYRYITRDKNEILYAYMDKPIKKTKIWDGYGSKCISKLNIGFPMVKWSDEEPWLIEDLKKLEVCDEY